MNLIIQNKMGLYSNRDYERQYYDLPEVINEYETPFESDVSRLLLSASFRRLVGKTQLFPSSESDFFRNRLTHSLEVEHIAQLIGRKIQKDTNHYFKINPFVLRFACYAHDLGHSPFGHSGEKKLNELMKESGGFEGNAQTLRILTCLEKGLCNIINNNIRATRRSGLNITFRSLASIIKYNYPLGSNKKGYYETEKELVEKINQTLGIGEGERTMECTIMDLADDISNAVHDLEDSLKGNFINLFDLFLPNTEILDDIIRQINNDKKYDNEITRETIYEALKRIFQSTSLLKDSEEDVISQLSDMYKQAQKISNDGFERSKFIKSLINKFIDGISLVLNEKNYSLSVVKFEEDTELEILVLKKFHRIYQHQSSQSEVTSYRGGYMIEQIFKAIEANHKLLPRDFCKEYELLEKEKVEFNRSQKTLICDSLGEKEYEELEAKKNEINKKQKRLICDFISGMTDSYCVEFYGKLFSENPKSYFKPIN